MSHYKDGTEAKIGDIVRGRGYNSREPIVGTVVGLVPDSESCNIQVAYIKTSEINVPHAAWQDIYQHFSSRGVVGCGANGGNDLIKITASTFLEYGECKSFEKVDL